MPIIGLSSTGYDPSLDANRLANGLGRVWAVMSVSGWLTLRDLSDRSKTPEASASAHLRSLRKAKHGGHVVEKRRSPVAGETSGVWEYRLVTGSVPARIRPVTSAKLRRLRRSRRTS